MKKGAVWLVAAALAMSFAVAACGDDEESGGGGGSTSESSGGEAGKVAVLLPDSKSSVRWETVDRPSLAAAFKAAGVEAEIQNAEGDKATQQQQAEQAITNGAKVILLVNLDSGSGAAISANAASQGVKVIDYDRLTLGSDTTDYYVSFNNEKVGQLQGQGLVDCMGDKQGAQVAVLNGSPTDNNATLFKKGYDSVINPKFDSGDWKEIDDQSVPDWDNQKALTIFEQILQKNNNKVDGVLAANDGLANAAISALKQRKLPQVPVTGQDATLQGIQNIVNGDQCMTVYKAIKKEADAAADLAIALAKGEKPTATTTPVNNETKDVPSVLLDPVPVTKDNIGDYTGEPDFPKVEEICAGKVAAKCKEVGLQERVAWGRPVRGAPGPIAAERRCQT
jgi:D-xylose transport system substrate-binding protein